MFNRLNWFVLMLLVQAMHSLFLTNSTIVLQVRSRIQAQENVLTVRLAVRPALLVNLTVLTLAY